MTTNLWKFIFTQNSVNDGYYGEVDLPHQHWEWPKATCLQARRDFIREHKQLVAANSAR